jgi:hypothetical protein
VNRKEILDQATLLTCGSRQEVYGTPHVNHSRIASMWSVILGRHVLPHEVALCMAATKIARLVESPDHVDSYVDGAAYMAIAAELAIEEEL